MVERISMHPHKPQQTLTGKVPCRSITATPGPAMSLLCVGVFWRNV